ncbi:hypothetical protein QYE76_017585 [Lolium multiflorum]|uniref:Retrotransposon gag domain-containing protein n=1 Tax=Lolium multiflorum TaxID=4521 RepID=A0AAD8QGW2_LOLMU|nr:hypothetical protein QYE76_017585 [Lolium multiflorum]
MKIKLKVMEDRLLVNKIETTIEMLNLNNVKTMVKKDHLLGATYEEEIFGKLKFTMPKFQGEEDIDAYLSWVLKVDKIFCIHNFSEAKKVTMESLEFEGYANVWWEEVNKKHAQEHLEPIDTWEEMQEVMHTRFVPSHHKRDLFNKLTQLKQSFKSVEEYYKEMHMTMMSANVDEREEQTMARFLNGLNIPVKRIVEFLPYTNMVELLHQATRAERQMSLPAKAPPKKKAKLVHIEDDPLITTQRWVQMMADAIAKSGGDDAYHNLWDALAALKI